MNATQKSIARLPQVKQQTRLSRSSIYSLIKKGQFPNAISLGPRAVGWLQSDIDAWLEKRIELSRKN